ncbi:uncharacterized protein [Miscanthus floridulus]|uniref:uncharacterized protein n=1 Tax=Miscanthus floridulus TaxID=154761 RepID=UPI00345AE742
MAGSGGSGSSLPPPPLILPTTGTRATHPRPRATTASYWPSLPPRVSRSSQRRPPRCLGRRGRARARRRLPARLHPKQALLPTPTRVISTTPRRPEVGVTSNNHSTRGRKLLVSSDTTDAENDAPQVAPTIPYDLQVHVHWL